MHILLEHKTMTQHHVIKPVGQRLRRPGAHAKPATASKITSIYGTSRGLQDNNRSFNIELFASITRSDPELEALCRVAPDPDHIAPEQLPLPSACGGWSGVVGLPTGSNVQSHGFIVKRTIIALATFNLLLVS